MPVSLRALCFLLPISILPAVIFLMIWPGKQTAKWIFIWLAVTAAAFISPSPFVYMGFLASVCFFCCGKDEQNKVLGFFLLLPAVHASVGYEIPGLVPGVRYWFFLNHARGLILFILLPLFFRIMAAPSWRNRLVLAMPTDKYMLAYLVLLSGLCFRAPTLTEIFRQIMLKWVDIFLPYYVISRSIRDERSLRHVFWAILLSSGFLSAAGLFEEVKKWDPYGATGALGGRTFFGSMGRMGILRVQTTFGQPIAFGFFLMIGIAGIFLFWRDLRKKLFPALVLVLLVFLALLLTVSRGPWVGAVAFVVLWFLTLQLSKKMRFLVMLVGAGLALLPFFLGTPLGRKVIQALPYIGTQEQETVDYREQLWTIGFDTAKKNPWFGSSAFREDEELKQLEVGGLIDVTNTYLQVALASGFTGLFLFGMIFLSLLLRLLKAFRSAQDDIGYREAGRTLFCLTVALLVVLATVSSISYIPYYYWSFVGLSAGYLCLKKISSDKA